MAHIAAPTNSVIRSAAIYRLYFHGPAYQVLEQAWRDGRRVVGKLAANLPAHHVPSEKWTLIDPRQIELCFQTAGLWEMSALGKLGLPQHIRQVSFLRAVDTPMSSLYAVVTPAADGSAFDAEVIDQAGNRFLQLSGYRTVALPESVDAGPLKALQAVAV